jgi:midasin
VGKTGSGKTSICQVFADAVSKHLHGLNCHQNTETADLIGGLRPIRNRSVVEAEVLREVSAALDQIGIIDTTPKQDSLLSSVDRTVGSPSLTASARFMLEDARRKLSGLKSIFEWHDGPLIEAMRSGSVFLLVSLADDSVLERLNSVLEPARTIVLAERGSDDLEHPAIQAADGFKLVATMNPGGDYGKKELSPALRNRFAEIWVPPVDDHSDLISIVDRLWKYKNFRPFMVPLLSFVEWLCARTADRSLLSLRDILVHFAPFAVKSSIDISPF